MDQHKCRKGFIHDTKHCEENRLPSLEHPLASYNVIIANMPMRHYTSHYHKWKATEAFIKCCIQTLSHNFVHVL